MPMNKYDLTGKTAIVTGARQGIGRIIAMRLAASGVNTVVTDLDKKACELVLREIRDAGGEGMLCG